MTFDFPDNDICMSNYVTDRMEDIAKALKPREYIVSRRTKPYSTVPYQSTHNTGGAIVGTDPKTSVVNKYLQSWDVPNVLVIGASAFPQNAGYNPTGTVGALAFLAADAIITKLSQGSRSTGAVMSSLGRRVIRIAALVAAVLAPCAAHAVDLQSYDLVERGRYLATAADCAACHTKPAGKPFAGGVALETPFGTLIGPNITPDPDAGVGAWTDADSDAGNDRRSAHSGGRRLKSAKARSRGKRRAGRAASAMGI
jgi:GMC oxidoreductase